MDGWSTLGAIHEAGKREFLAHGFRSASLRKIARAAGVTTGAFYGYYKSKEDLFSDLVEEQYSTLMARYKEAHEEFVRLPPDEQPTRMGEISGDCLLWATDYVYDHFDVFKLILCCSEGTKYANMVHEMVELEVQSTHEFIAVLKSLGRAVPRIDLQLEHILVSGLLTAFFEMVVHDMPREKAHGYVHSLRAFYLAGWKELIGV